MMSAAPAPDADVSASNLLQALPLPACWLTPAGGLRQANPAFCALAGIPHPVPDLYPAPAWLLPPEPGAAQWSTRVDGSPDGLLTVYAAAPVPGELVLVLVPAETDLGQAQRDFVSVVSHEFRTPLTSIKGFADTLLRYGGQLSEAQQTHFIAIIKDQADRLTRLVENLLTLSKLGAGRMTLSLRPVPLPRLLERVVQSLEAKGRQDKQYAGRQIVTDIAPSLPEVWADPDRLEQVLLNLVDNAVKYAFPESVVQVRALLSPEDPEQIRMTVTNRGVGIPPEHQDKIFARFSRLDNPLTRQVEGTGLGLYITRSLVEAMGGRIGVDSTPNETTTFHLLFPAATPERQAAYRRRLVGEGETP